MFEILKPGCQGQLLSSDLHSFAVEKFTSALDFFMTASAEEGREEGEGWADEGGEWGGGGWEEGGGGEWGYSELGDEVDLEEGGGDYPHDHQPHDEL